MPCGRHVHVHVCDLHATCHILAIARSSLFFLSLTLTLDTVQDMDESSEGASPRTLLKSLRGMCTKLVRVVKAHVCCDAMRCEIP